MKPDEPAAAAPAVAAPAAVSTRGERSPRDMALSLAVLLIPIALLLIFYRVVLGGDAPIDVNTGPVLQEARQAALFPVAEPTGLDEHWHVASATFRRQTDGATLRLGYVDPSSDPIQLVESNVAPEKLLPAELGNEAKPTKIFRTTAGVWRHYTARPGEQAMVLTEPNRTIVLVGAAEAKNFETMATALS